MLNLDSNIFLLGLILTHLAQSSKLKIIRLDPTQQTKLALWLKHYPTQPMPMMNTYWLFSVHMQLIKQYKYSFRYLISLIFFFNYLDDKCQFWMDDRSKVLKSPYFDSKSYYHNLNCTWMLKADQGSYINFEIDNFLVKNNT